MDRQYVVAHNIVDRYIRGELAPEEAAAFEEHYLEDPETLEELELATELGDHAGESRPEADRIQVGVWGLGALLAATAVASVVAYSLLVPKVSLPQGNFQIVGVAAMRGAAEPTIRLRLDKGHSLVGLRMEVPPTTGTVALNIARQGSVVIALDGLEIDPLGDVLVAIPTAELKAGVYELRVVDEADKRTVLEGKLEIL